MYKEFEKLFPEVKLPVKINENVMKYHLEKQLNNSETLEKNFILFSKVFKKYPDFKKYSEAKQLIIDNIQEYIEKMTLFINYSKDKESDFNKTSIQRSSKIVDFYVRNQKSFSKDKNDKVSLSDKYLFIQFDMIEGNFNVLKEYHKQFFKNIEDININDKNYISSNSFNDLLDKIFENNNLIDKELLEVIKSSKGIRQLIYGSLGLKGENSGNIPKKNDKMMAYTLNKMYELLKEELTEFEIVGQSQDEFIFAIPKEKIDKNFIKYIRGVISKEKLPIRSKIISYDIVPEIKSNSKDEPKKYYIEKEIDEENFLENNKLKFNKSKLKSVPKNNYIPMFIKYILEKELEKQDLYVENDGNLYQMIL
jgi:hypothetical protein